MATSGSYDFTVNTTQIVTRALQILGVLPGGTSATGDQLTDATLHLNLMLKSWQNDGMQLWRVAEKTFAVGDGLLSGTYAYTLGTAGTITTSGRPEDLLGVYYRETSTSNQTPMIRISREQYYALPNPTTSGTPTQYWYDPLLTPKIYFWPAPDDNFMNNYTVVIVYQMPFDDMDSTTDTLAFPQSWELAVVWNLAEQLSTEYGLPIPERQWVSQEALKHKNMALMWDTEHTSIFFQPGRYKGSD